MYDIRRDIPKEAPHFLTQLALFGGISFFFISLIFPLQFLGLAAVLILASFLYQRYLLRQDKPEAHS